MINYQKVDGEFSLLGKIALVTGAANGIGKATARLFAQKGAKLVLVDLQDQVFQVAAEIRQAFEADVVAVVGDITDAASIDATVKKAVDNFGTIDILANIAGAVELEDAATLPMEYWDKMMNVNARGSFMMCQKVGNVMIKAGRGGKIVNITSQAGFIAIKKHVAYTASKAALIGMTKVLALEWAEYGINVNAVAPTVVLTEMGAKAWQGEVAENMKTQIPANRFAYPDEIAAAVLFLSCNESAMITGENLVVDGGFTIK
jgi:glycerol dehydrogenase